MAWMGVTGEYLTRREIRMMRNLSTLYDAKIEEMRSEDGHSQTGY